MNTKSGRYEFTVVLLCFLGWGFVFMDRLVLSWQSPVIMESLNISNTQYGMLGFATNIFYVISAIFFGALSDRIGARKKIIVPLLFITGIAAAAGVFAYNFTSLFIIRCFVGIAEGPMLPLMASLVKDASDERRFGMNMGIVNCGVGAIGTTTGALLVTQLAAHVSWQMTFLLSAIPTFIVAFLFIGLIKEIHVEVEDKPKEKVPVAAVLKYKNVLICSIIAILGMAGYWTGMLFAPLYLTQVAGQSVTAMGGIGALMGVLYVVYCFIVPTLSDKFGRKPVLALAFLLAALSPLSMFLFPGTGLSIVCYVVFAGFAASMTPLYHTLVPMESVPIAMIASANAVVMGIGDLIGTAIYPMVAGGIADAKGLPIMRVFAAIAFVIKIILAVALTETHPRKTKKDQSSGLAA
jgi:MFS family permease